MQSNIQDLGDAVTIQRAVLSCDHPNKSSSAELTKLAGYLRTRSSRLKRTQDLEEAIQCYRQAFIFHPAGHTDGRETLSDLADCLYALYQQQCGEQNLEQAINYNRKSLLLHTKEHPGRATRLEKLALCIEAQFWCKGRAEDVEEVITLRREALMLCPPGNSGRPDALINLSHALRTRYINLGHMQDVKESISFNKEALHLYPEGHPNRPMCMNNLGLSLCDEYHRAGRIQDLDEAISYHRKALLLYPMGHENIPVTLTNLANCLEARYDEVGHIQEMETAIESNKQAVLLYHADDLRSTYLLHTLAGCLMSQYEKHNRIEDLQQAVDYFRRLLSQCPPGHLHRPATLNNLGKCLIKQHMRLGTLQCLEDSIHNFKEALELCHKDHPDRPYVLTNLATCYVVQYEKDGKDEILKEAVELLHMAIKDIPPDHPFLTRILTLLASTYADHAKALKQNYDPQEFFQLFSQAANHPTATIKDRYSASLKWVERLHGLSSLHAYPTYFALADRYLLMRSSLTSRYELLNSIPPWHSCDAAAFAIEAEDLEKAVEFLEQGGNMLWSQMGRYRMQLVALQGERAPLVEEFTRLSRLMERSATSSISNQTTQRTIEEQASTYRRVTEEWEALVEQIRNVRGFGNFLLPPRYSHLQRSSQNGPVIIINVSVVRCDALIITVQNPPVLVPLPSVRMVDVHRYTLEFIDVVREGPSCRRSLILSILRNLWDDMILPILDKLQELGVRPGSRIWWCPTSYLSCLPIHAAGPHKGRNQNLPDLYVSSYTPTLSALLRSIHADTSPCSTYTKNPSPRLLVIAQPRTPGQEGIPKVKEEIGRIQTLVKSVDVLLGEKATHQAVLNGLGDHSWVHFACHASQKVGDPFNSRFHLHDESLTLLNIMEARPEEAQFAFLPACHSAAVVGNIRPHEAINLANSLQFVGFRSVIGTMYAMADIDGPLLSEHVYKHLFRRVNDGSGDLVDYRDAAEALNIATRALRDAGVPIERWINFVHIGA
ncbi:hypothetical protein FRC02_007767 [Tulasnella sp. 418]|nr:hypothetical protein FRC02_007767 [Tulasnella sp. 418]